MKLLTNIKFIDSKSDELHEVGEVFEVDDERAKELLSDSRKLVSKVKETKPEKVKEIESSAEETTKMKKSKK